MTGPYQEVNTGFMEGDSYSFDNEQLKNTGDPDLDRLTTIIDDMESLAARLQNLYRFTPDELTETWSDLLQENHDYYDNPATDDN